MVHNGLIKNVQHYNAINLGWIPGIFGSSFCAKNLSIRYLEYILNSLNSQLNHRMTSLPANFRFYRILKISFSQNFIAPKNSPWNFRRSLKGDFWPMTPSSGFKPLVYILNFELLSSAWQKWTQLFNNKNPHRN